MLCQTVAQLFDSLPAGAVSLILCNIQLHFTANWKQLVASYREYLWGELNVRDNSVKLREHRLNPSQEIRPQVGEDGIFHAFRDIFRWEIASDVMPFSVRTEPTCNSLYAGNAILPFRGER